MSKYKILKDRKDMPPIHVMPGDKLIVTWEERGHENIITETNIGRSGTIEEVLLLGNKSKKEEDFILIAGIGTEKAISDFKKKV